MDHAAIAIAASAGLWRSNAAVRARGRSQSEESSIVNPWAKTSTPKLATRIKISVADLGSPNNTRMHQARRQCGWRRLRGLLVYVSAVGEEPHRQFAASP